MKFEFLNGSTGEQSSKRLFTFILVILVSITIISNLFWGKELKPSLEDYLFQSSWLTFFGVLFEKAIDSIGSKISGSKIIKDETK